MPAHLRPRQNAERCYPYLHLCSALAMFLATRGNNAPLKMDALLIASRLLVRILAWALALTVSGALLLVVAALFTDTSLRENHAGCEARIIESRIQGNGPARFMNLCMTSLGYRLLDVEPCTSDRWTLNGTVAPVASCYAPRWTFWAKTATLAP